MNRLIVAALTLMTVCSCREKSNATFSETKFVHPRPQWESLNNSGMAKKKKGDLDGAIADLTTAIGQSSDKNTLVLHNRGILYHEQGDYQKAIDDLTPVIEQQLQDQQERAYFLLIDLQMRSDSFLRVGNTDAAISDYETLIARYPKDPAAYENLAWLLATHPDAEIRDGQKALHYAEEAHNLKNSASSFEALAAAHAEIGDFATAVMFQQKSFDGLGTLDQSKRLEQYSQNKPCREDPKSENARSRTLFSNVLR